jgi:hypothetical protein
MPQSPGEIWWSVRIRTVHYSGAADARPFVCGSEVTGRVDDADMHHGGVELIGVDELSASSTTRLAVHWPEHSGRTLADVLNRIDILGVRYCCYSVGAAG